MKSLLNVLLKVREIPRIVSNQFLIDFDKSDIASEVWPDLAIKHAYHQSWRGMLLNKGPLEISLLSNVARSELARV